MKAYREWLFSTISGGIPGIILEGTTGRVSAVSEDLIKAIVEEFLTEIVESFLNDSLEFVKKSMTFFWSNWWNVF